MSWVESGLQCNTYARIALAEESRIMYHQNVKDNLQDTHLEDFGCRLKLINKQLERIYRHSL